MEKSAVTGICMVPRGRCRGRLAPQEADDDEAMKEVHADLTAGGSGASASTSTPADVSTAGLEEFGMDTYDDEDNDGGMQFFSVLNADADLAKEKDPHLTNDQDSESGSEGEVEIREEDHVFLATSCEEDACTLEVYVFEEDEASMYVHHDVALGAYPLCVEWISRTSSSEDGNFAAVGSIDHTIQIWDLEQLDPLEPHQVLGVAKKKPKSKGKAKKKEAGGRGCCESARWTSPLPARQLLQPKCTCQRIRRSDSEGLGCGRWHLCAHLLAPLRQGAVRAVASDRTGRDALSSLRPASWTLGRPAARAGSHG
mmetsp:Transcript_77594/g.136918  ORF Transcript_77594/g.136918 Transcript_77594/m.136918 type:complete len:312 (-) Transcript_77594:503-1438(-)